MSNMKPAVHFEIPVEGQESTKQFYNSVFDGVSIRSRLFISG